MTDREQNVSSSSDMDGEGPLIFGVSGHRDIVPADLPLLREQIELVFSRFRAVRPGIPFQLLTPLAEGADRLVAEVAISLQVKLLVPLPMAQGEYERDFQNPSSLAEFRRLLALADSSWPVLTSDGARQTRTEQYAAVGDYIARRSHVLLLLWDGVENNKVGGTAWVRKRREYWVEAASQRSDQPSAHKYGPTIQVVTPRVATAGDPRHRPRVEILGDLP
jgi:hypothetical protein